MDKSKNQSSVSSGQANPSWEIAPNSLLQAAHFVGDHAILVVGWRTRLIFAANDAVEKTFVYKPHEIINRTTEFLHKDVASFNFFGEKSISVIEQGKDTFHCYYQMRRKTGELFNSENILSLIRNIDGEPIACVSIVIDLADPHASPAFKASKAFLDAISNNLPGAVYQRILTPDNNTRYNFVRGNLLNRFGITSAEIEADPSIVFDAMSEYSLTIFEKAWRESARDLSPIDIELVAFTPEGEQVDIRAISTPRRLDDGSIVWDGIVLDISG